MIRLRAVERAGLCRPRDVGEKIVLNRISNSFKFTFEGEIEVSLREAGTAVELTVRDTGTGIPVEEIPRLFDRFHRVKGAGAPMKAAASNASARAGQAAWRQCTCRE